MAPAVEHAFTEPLPSAVIVDADFVVNVLNEAEEFHNDCTLFARRLLASDVLVVYSQLIRLEVIAGWRNSIRQSRLPAVVRGRQAGALPALEEGYRAGLSLLARFLSAFRRREVRLSIRLQEAAVPYMARHNLRPMDACLVAAAFTAGVPHIASLDRDLRKVDGIELWNDRIPARRRRR